MPTENDPRFLRSREAILHAARDLLLERGPAAVTHVQVAERAAVGRATVYRHWPRAELLLMEAMATVPMPFFSDPTVPTRDWLRRELTAIARQLDLDDVRAVSTTLAGTALWDTDMDARRAQFAGVLTDRLAAALDGAQTRGEITLAIPSRDAAALAIGPMYYRSTIEHSPTGTNLIEATIEALGTWSTASSPRQ
ncbi:TetR/AcrR family transcriptional regulator [Actinoplanes derwentensis]|uniref:DNA-binding transcriptional regulator, AcrR family n=1 Tax=Actinoplanes derwentensis TaxID=113562 RepID=A0A1H1U9M9_9ACTN|nr:TetR/AcrR family transcriptional regulator [Actinoplanes derwentensis]GID85241.1 TetR family transcriptional regulator [Actinoplanes derwentensis]SDS69208.1 DNA-binding transcriptional regulator, AcrR family [Actinoplanes derwentensis]